MRWLRERARLLREIREELRVVRAAMRLTNGDGHEIIRELRKHRCQCLDAAGKRGAAAMSALKIAAEEAVAPPSPSRRSTAIAMHFTADDARAIAREVKAAEERHNALSRERP